MPVTTPKVSKITAAHMKEIISASMAERGVANARQNRMTFFLSDETLEAIQDIAETLDLKHPQSKRIFTPELIKIAIDTLNRVVNDEAPIVLEPV